MSDQLEDAWVGVLARLYRQRSAYVTEIGRLADGITLAYEQADRDGCPAVAEALRALLGHDPLAGSATPTGDDDE
jgi:hypothetical protein